MKYYNKSNIRKTDYPKANLTNRFSLRPNVYYKIKWHKTNKKVEEKNQRSSPLSTHI